MGDPNANIGPLVSQVQWDRVQGYLKKGIDEGARVVTGGPGKPAGLEDGYFVKPTVFADINNKMTIAQEEIFGPVLSIIPYESSSIFAISVSSSQGFTSKRSEDLAITAVFVAFFAWYAASRSSLILFSSSVSSSSESSPNMSKSSSLSLASAGALGASEASTTAKLFCSSGE